ncbi:MAG TPA: NAD(P)-dependent oxidoreductase [Aquella sp.]|nr:NAD(P)-dependent oxidoreductase [Aquella sp.]
MKILIVGGNSNVGISLKGALSPSNKIVTLGRKGNDLELDLNNLVGKFDLPPDFDVIIHTAAGFGVRSDEDILSTESVNVLGTLKLCQAAVQARTKHFIFISSIYTTVSNQSGHYNFYSLSKKHAEDVASLYCSLHKLPLTILRLSPLYGNMEGFKIHQPFFYLLIEKASRGEDIILFGKNDPLRNYLHIDDLVEIIKRIIVQKVFGTYSCTNINDVTYSQIAQAAFTAFNKTGRVYFDKDKPDIPDSIFEKDFSLYDSINYFPVISIHEGMLRMAKSKKSNI